MNRKETIEYLRNNPVFWSRLGFCYDPPISDAEGKPLVFNPDFSNTLKTHDAFCDAGVKIHTCILHSGWVGVNKYDYSLCDRVLESIFASGKVEYFIPRIKLNVPIDWCFENPEEVFVYEAGPRSAEEIRALVGTEQHDYLGYEASYGYYNAEGWKDPRPNVGGLIARQSFSSEKWLEDAGETLRRLIKRLEAKWGDRILAYHIAYGTSGESMLWGRQSGKFGDYGITNSKKFREWGIRKYGSEEKMLLAWGVASGEEIVPPSILREKPFVSPEISCRNDVSDCWSLDYDIFTGEVNTDAMMYFGDIVHDCSGGKPAGAFYGYNLYVARSAYTGFYAWDRLLKSDSIDFFAGPKPYHRWNGGEPGCVMAPTASINKTHLWLDECDIRTHISGMYNALSDAKETDTVLLRETCKNIAHNSGLWYMDLGGGWYDDPGIMKQIHTLLKASEQIRIKKHQSVAQIIVIADDESRLRMHPSMIIPALDVLCNLQLTGAPVDIALSNDIEALELSNIKLAVLLDPLKMAEEKVLLLRKLLPENATLMFCGDCDGREYEEDDIVLPEAKADVLQLREVVEQAGVHCYAPAECTVYADNRMVSFFPREDMSFIPKMERTGVYIDIYSCEEYVQGTMIKAKAKDGIAYMLR